MVEQWVFSYASHAATGNRKGAHAIEHCNKCLDDSLFSWERWLIARKVDAGPEQQTQDIEYVHNAIAEKNQEEEFAARIDPVVDTTIRKEAP